jgi:hypothetical protein
MARFNLFHQLLRQALENSRGNRRIKSAPSVRGGLQVETLEDCLAPSADILAAAGVVA